MVNCMKTLNKKNNITKEELIKDLYFACKHPGNFKIGIEYERITIDKNNQSVNYYGDNGIKKLLEKFSLKYNWDKILDCDNLIGIEKDKTTITLEPGGQIEISLSPQKSLADIEINLEDLKNRIDIEAKNLGINILEYGITPASKIKDIDIIPKRRYLTMSNYLPLNLALVMMKQTSGIQVIFDYESEEDAIKKLALSSKLSPIVTGIFANSPIYEQKDSGYKSYRAYAWCHTDNNRCGIISSKLFNYFSFSDYIDKVFNIPMIFIVRNNRIINIDGKITFKTFYESGYQGFQATKDDFLLQASLFFPDVRLKNYIEIRNHDCQKGKLKYAIPALYKGLFSSYKSLSEASEILKPFSYDDIKIAQENSAKSGLEAKIGDYKISDISKEILKLAYDNLDYTDQKYLEPILEINYDNLSPADIILKNWYGSWNQNFSKFINYLKS